MCVGVGQDTEWKQTNLRIIVVKIPFLYLNMCDDYHYSIHESLKPHLNLKKKKRIHSLHAPNHN